MAVVQIAKIQVRSGLQEDLPTLDTGEFGWSIDERRLWIGNGTLEEGAPEIGNTEILTVYGAGALIADVNDLANVVANLQSDVNSLSSGILETATLTNNTTPAANVVNATSNLAVNITSLGSNTLDYSIVRGSTARSGVIKITNDNGTVYYDDEYNETATATGVTLSFANFGGAAVLQYTTTNTGSNATFKYYLKSFS